MDMQDIVKKMAQEPAKVTQADLEVFQNGFESTDFAALAATETLSPEERQIYQTCARLRQMQDNPIDHKEAVQANIRKTEAAFLKMLNDNTPHAFPLSGKLLQGLDLPTKLMQRLMDSK